MGGRGRYGERHAGRGGRRLSLRALRRLGIDLAPLRDNPDYRCLFTAMAVSRLGDNITAVAFPYQVWQLTKSPVAVGLIGLAELLPLLVLSLVGGAWADAHDRRRTVLASEAGLLACSVTLAGLAVLERPPLWALYVLAALASALTGFHRPSLEAMIPRLTRPDQQPAVAALRSTAGTFAQVAGPAVGGVLIAAVGLVATYLVDVLTFAISLAFVRRLPAVAPERAEPPSLHRIGEGLRYALGRRDLLGTYLVDMVAMFFAMPTALFPAIADRLGGSRVLGALFAAQAAGAFVVSVTSGWTRRVRHHGLAVALAAAAWGLAILGFGLADGPGIAMAWLAVAGGADMVSGIFRMTMWNQTIPDHMRGRLAGIEQLSYLSGPHLGNVRAGFAAALLGIRGAVVSGGVLCVAGTVALTAALPAFRRYDAVTTPHRAGGPR